MGSDTPITNICASASALTSFTGFFFDSFPHPESSWFVLSYLQSLHIWYTTFSVTFGHLICTFICLRQELLLDSKIMVENINFC